MKRKEFRRLLMKGDNNIPRSLAVYLAHHLIKDGVLDNIHHGVIIKTNIEIKLNMFVTPVGDQSMNLDENQK